MAISLQVTQSEYFSWTVADPPDLAVAWPLRATALPELSSPMSANPTPHFQPYACDRGENVAREKQCGVLTTSEST